MSIPLNFGLIQTFSTATICVSSMDVVSIVSAGCTVAPTTAPLSRSTACSALSGISVSHDRPRGGVILRI